MTTALHSINRPQRLYVLSAGRGFSCLGYDVAEKRRRALWDWVGQECPAIRKGSKRHYEDYRAAVAAASYHSDSLRKRGARDWKCPVELDSRLIGLEGRRVEVTGPSDYKRRFWVSRSGGWMPCHIEIARRDSMSGCAAYIPQGATVRVVA